MNRMSNPDALPGIPVLEQAAHHYRTPRVGRHGRATPLETDHADRWSISEVLAHLADVEVAGFRERVEKMMAEKNPKIAAYDQEAHYAAGKYSKDRAKENLKNFCHERDRSPFHSATSRCKPPRAPACTKSSAPLHLGNLMNEWAFHDLGHIRQITELYRANAFYPYARPVQGSLHCEAVNAASLVVTLYTREGCHLCDEAQRPRYFRSSHRTKPELREIDIDDDAELRAMYNDSVPVIFVGADFFARHRVDAAGPRRAALRARTRRGQEVARHCSARLMPHAPATRVSRYCLKLVGAHASAPSAADLCHDRLFSCWV